MTYRDEKDFHNDIKRFLEEELKIDLIHNNNLQPYRNGLINTNELLSALKMINKQLKEDNNWSNDEYHKHVSTVANKIISNSRTNYSSFAKTSSINFDILLKGLSIPVENTEKKRKEQKRFRIIDFQNKNNNKLTYATELRVVGDRGDFRFDLVIFLNGLPIIPIELKFPTIPERDEYDKANKKAIKQLLEYKAKGVNAFSYALFMIAGVPRHSRIHSITSRGGDETSTYWYDSLVTNKDDSTLKEGHKLQETLRLLLNVDTILNLISKYIYHINDNERRYQIFPRRHQYFTTERNIIPKLREIKNNKGANNNILTLNHTTGSGKSIQFVYIIKQFKVILNNYHYMIMTDRKELQEQAFKEIYRASSTGFIANLTDIKSLEDLKSTIRTLKETGHPQALSVNIQKFQSSIADSTKYEGDNIVIISDESHRTHKEQSEQAKELGKETFRSTLQKMLPNSKYIGVTATPKEQTKEQFGEHDNGLSLKEAIDDKICVPYEYQNKRPEVGLKKSAELEYTDGATEKELEKISKDFKSIYLNEKMVTLIVKSICNSFWEFEKENRLAIQNINDNNKEVMKTPKALVAFPDIQTAQTYLEELKIIDKELYNQTILITSNKSANTGDKLARDLRRQLVDENSNKNIAFVVDMCTVGFNAPILNQIYLVKRLNEMNFFQLIARAARSFKNKREAYIIDYIGFEKFIWKLDTKNTFSGGKQKGVVTNPTIEHLEEAYKEIISTIKKNYPKPIDDEKVIETIINEEKVREEVKYSLKIKNKNKDFLDWLRRFRSFYKSLSYKVLTNKYKELYETLEIIIAYFNSEKIKEEEEISNLFNRLIDIKERESERIRLTLELLEIIEKNREAEEVEEINEEIVFKDENSPTKKEVYEFEQKVIKDLSRSLSSEELLEEIKKLIDKFNNEGDIESIIKAQRIYSAHQKRENALNLDENQRVLWDIFKKEETKESFDENKDQYRSLCYELIGVLTFEYQSNLDSPRTKLRVIKKCRSIAEQQPGIKEITKETWDEIYKALKELDVERKDRNEAHESSK